MRNKSKKRIMHELRVENARLRRALEADRMKRQFDRLAQEYEPQKIELALYIAPNMNEYAHKEAKRLADNDATHKIIEALARGEIIERSETEEQGCTKVSYRLIVMKRRRRE